MSRWLPPLASCRTARKQPFSFSKDLFPGSLYSDDCIGESRKIRNGIDPGEAMQARWSQFLRA